MLLSATADPVGAAAAVVVVSVVSMDIDNLFSCIDQVGCMI